MRLAYNFEELAAQSAQWFALGFNYYVKQNLYNFDQAEESELALQIENYKLFHFLTENRYKTLPDRVAEDWLNKEFNFGATGYILDIIYIESDETSLTQFPVTYREMPSTHPEEAKIAISIATNEIQKELINANMPSGLIFGEMNVNEEYNRLRNDHREALLFFAHEYMQSLI